MIKKSTKKALLISAAIKLWQETHDVNKVSLADIARTAGVSPTTVYNNFSTREGLIEDVVRHLIGEVLDKQWSIIQSDLPFPQKMQGIISAKMNNLKGLHTDILDKFSTDPVMVKYMDEIYRTEMRPMMTAIMEEGKLQGYIHPDLPVEAVMVYLDILKAGGTACARELHSIVTDPRMMAGLTRIIYFGIFQKEFDFSVDKEDR